jgi:acetolactate decarboxylase
MLNRGDAMPMLNCQIPQALMNTLEQRSKANGQSISLLVTHALSHCFGVPLNTLFQISTTGALVEGIYEKAVSTKVLLNYGDFGLGTFEHLDGEMVILDGSIYQVSSDGTVSKIVDEVGTPFAVVVPFVADQDADVEHASSLEEVTAMCDRFRDSENLFYAFRIDGHFNHVHTRAMRATLDGLPLAKAAAIQPEFEFTDITGTLVGIWAPKYSSALNVAGYHFHFLSEDRSKGGHLLECSAKNLRVAVERLNHFHLSLPESEEFLKADLTRDPSKELAYAEQVHKKEGA